MRSLERRKFELHSRTEGHHDRIDQAVEWIGASFDRFDNPCLNYSGGKDSIVLLHLTATVCGHDDVAVYHFDNGLLSVPGNESFVRESVNRIGGELLVRTSEAANSDQMVTEEGHGYAGFWGWYNHLADERDWDCRLLGIRAEESPKRRDRFNSDGSALPIEYGDYTTVAPIHDLTTRDVWAYIVDNDLQYHSIYDEQGELFDAMEDPGNRLALLYDSEFDSVGARTVSKFLYPPETNELQAIEQDELP